MGRIHKLKKHQDGERFQQNTKYRLKRHDGFNKITFEKSGSELPLLIKMQDNIFADNSREVTRKVMSVPVVRPYDDYLRDPERAHQRHMTFSQPVGTTLERGERVPLPPKRIPKNPIEGDCRPGLCGKEAACLKYPNFTHICVCPHDSSPPTSDLKCPNRITVPLTPQPIHNIILPSGGNNTSMGNYTSTSTTEQPNIKGNNDPLVNTSLWTIPREVTLLSSVSVIGAFLMVTFVLLVIIFRVKRFWCFDGSPKSSTSCTAQSPKNLKKSLLIAERYTLNPQYSVCTSSSVPLLSRDSIKFQQEIGEGCFGKVFKGELKRDHNENTDSEVNGNQQIETVAIKVLKETASLEAEEDFMREVDIMSTFRHKNILSLIGVVLRENGLCPWMVFEYMPHGDLAEVLRSNSKSPGWQAQPHAGLNMVLTREHLMSAAKQIAAGMRYLAAQRFVHRDLACRNCLVGTGLTVKIADFGMSRDVYTCDYYKIGGSRLLPVRWMSPESVMYGRFTLESDVWSYGVVLWEIFSYGKQPYFGHNNEEVVKLILQGIMLIPPDDCPQEICEIMRCCWKTEPRDRIRFNEIYDRFNSTQLVKTTSSIECCPQKGNTLPTMGYSSTFKKSKSFSTNRTTTLPRPPPVPVVPNFDILDREGYLMPQPAKGMEYIQTLPD